MLTECESRNAGLFARGGWVWPPPLSGSLRDAMTGRSGRRTPRVASHACRRLTALSRVNHPHCANRKPATYRHYARRQARSDVDWRVRALLLFVVPGASPRLRRARRRLVKNSHRDWSASSGGGVQHPRIEDTVARLVQRLFLPGRIASTSRRAPRRVALSYLEARAIQGPDGRLNHHRGSGRSCWVHRFTFRIRVHPSAASADPGAAEYQYSPASPTRATMSATVTNLNTWPCRRPARFNDPTFRHGRGRQLPWP